jgi:hypothetical protein
VAWSKRRRMDEQATRDPERWLVCASRRTSEGQFEPNPDRVAGVLSVQDNRVVAVEIVDPQREKAFRVLPSQPLLEFVGGGQRGDGVFFDAAKGIEPGLAEYLDALREHFKQYSLFCISVS